MTAFLEVSSSALSLSLSLFEVQKQRVCQTSVFRPFKLSVAE